MVETVIIPFLKQETKTQEDVLTHPNHVADKLLTTMYL